MRTGMAALVLAITSFIGAACAAEQQAPRIDAARVATTGAKPGDFVPRGWKIAAQVQGDLNGDGKPDHVLHVVPASSHYETGGVGAAPEAHALMILLTDDKGLRRAGLAERLLVREVPQWGVQMTIRNGVLITVQNYGMSDVSDVTHRFRLDPASGRFLLIGKDQFSYQRPLSRDDTIKISENYLTGVRLTTTGHVRKGVVVKETNKKEQFDKKRVHFEDVDEVTER